MRISQLSFGRFIVARTWTIACAGIGMLFFLAPAVLAGETRSIKDETLQRAKRASVMVFNAASRSSKGDTPLGSGSGFFINSNGLLITNNHVVDPGHKKPPQEKFQLQVRNNTLVQTVITNSGTDEEKTWECNLLYQNESADQALLQALDEDGNKLETEDFLHFLPESWLKEEKKVYALGFPGGDSRSTSRGKHPLVNVTSGHIVSLPKTPAGRVRMINTDVIVRPGNSGGPTVDVDGFLVGTVTLLTNDQDRANGGALVPAALSRDFLRAAFALGKVPSGVDVVPFGALLTDKDGRINIPEFKRLPSKDTVFSENGDRQYGTVATDHIRFESPLGTFDVPAAAVAYIMTNDEGSHLFLEGGNRIFSEDVTTALKFNPTNGSPREYPIDELHVVSLRTSERSYEPVTGNVLDFASNLGRFILVDVTGTVDFESEDGTNKIALDQIEVIDQSEDGEQVVSLLDGQRMTGQFSDQKFTAKIAATNTPISFTLSDVETARVQKVSLSDNDMLGLSIVDILADAEKEVRSLGTLLFSGDVADARAKLSERIKSREFGELSAETKDQLKLLAAFAALLDSDARAASKAFRKSKKSGNDNIAAFAKAGESVLKRYPDFAFDGKPLSDFKVFIRAGVNLANENVHRARTLLKNARRGGRRPPFATEIGGVKKMEKAIEVASVFGGTEAEDIMFWLWSYAENLCRSEIARIDEEIDELRGTTGGRGGQNRGARGGRGGGRNRRASRGGGGALQRKIDALQEKRDKVVATLGDYLVKSEFFGFRLEDPDIMAQAEKNDKP